MTKSLSEINEKAGDITTASDLLQELQVETFSSMERREKVEFVLEQMRLLKLQSDFEKFFIVSKRINLKWLTEPDHEDLKLKFYELMIIWGLHSKNYLQVTKFYRQIYDSPSIESDSTKYIPILRNIVYFIILSPYDNEQSDLLERIAKDEKLVKIAESFNLIKCFTTPELMRWPGIEDLYGKSLQSTKVFSKTEVEGVAGDITESLGKGADRYEDLHSRVVEHVRHLSFLN